MVVVVSGIAYGEYLESSAGLCRPGPTHLGFYAGEVHSEPMTPGLGLPSGAGLERS